MPEGVFLFISWQYLYTVYTTINKGENMTKTYWIKFNNKDFKQDKELVYKMLTDLRLQEINKEEK